MIVADVTLLSVRERVVADDISALVILCRVAFELYVDAEALGYQVSLDYIIITAKLDIATREFSGLQIIPAFIARENVAVGVFLYVKTF